MGNHRRARVVVVSHDAAVASGAIGAVMAESIRSPAVAIDKGYPIVYINDRAARAARRHLPARGGGSSRFNIEPRKRIPPDLADPRSVRRCRRILTGAADGRSCQGAGGRCPDRPRHRQAATGEVVTAEDIAAPTSTPGSAARHLRSTARKRRSRDPPAAVLPADPQGAPQKRRARPANPGAVERLPGLVPERSSVVFDMNALLDGVLDNGARQSSCRPTRQLLTRSPASTVTRSDPGNQPNARRRPFSTRRRRSRPLALSSSVAGSTCGADLRRLPGSCPPVEESRSIITHGAKLLKAYVRATSPNSPCGPQGLRRRLHRDGCRVARRRLTGLRRARRSP